MVRDYKEGAKVFISEECIEKMEHSSNSVAAMYPSKSYIDVAKKVKGMVGTVTKRFKPGYEFNVEWDFPYERHDGTIQDVTILQVKDHWVEPLDNNWKEIC